MVVTITLNPSFDKSVVVNGFNIGAVNKISEMRIDAGGKGVNVSKVLNVLGCQNVATGISGRNNFQDYSALLDAIHVNHDFVLTDGNIRTNIKINDPITCTTTDINQVGNAISVKEMLQLKTRLLNYDNSTVFVLSGSIGSGTDPKMVSELITLLGSRVIVDTSGIALKESVKSKPYIIKPNIHEFSELIGKNFTDNSDIIKSAKELLNCGIYGVMITLGSKGLIFVTKEHSYLSHGIQSAIKCTVGAGDAVTASIAYSVVNNLSSKELTALASALGSAAVATDGSQAPDINTINYYMQLADITEL